MLLAMLHLLPTMLHLLPAMLRFSPCFICLPPPASRHASYTSYASNLASYASHPASAALPACTPSLVFLACNVSDSTSAVDSFAALLFPPPRFWVSALESWMRRRSPSIWVSQLSMVFRSSLEVQDGFGKLRPRSPSFRPTYTPC
ncbi:hypothetical protein B0H17DRAFT_421280 [Mycena rosella]|uniref:Secreted protein n=1 Tax=Mycena rosella TaxID=1033263 RepID=A0AAD7CJH7_MYCRO|nr:hypothetical protein B0H17DRAFT_421280 [Mycena rosella]